MIIDQLANAKLYYSLGKGVADALRFLQEADLTRLPLGRNEIRGDALYASVAEYMTKDEAECRWEVHHRYTDVQLMVAGEEEVGYQCLSLMESVGGYDEKTDALFLRGKGNRLGLSEGFFVIFMPHDAHRGAIKIGASRLVRKVVVKTLAK